MVSPALALANRVVLPPGRGVAILALEQSPTGGVGVVPLRGGGGGVGNFTVLPLRPAAGTNQTESTKCYCAAEFAGWLYAFSARTSTLYAAELAR